LKRQVHPRLWLPCLAVLTTAPLAALAGHGDREKVPLTQYATKYYDLKTNLTKAEARAYAEHMDEVFAAYVQRFQHFGKDRRERMALYLFKTQRDYMVYLAGLGINASNSAGIFFFADRATGLAAFVEDQPRSKVFATLQHEGFHQFAYHYLGESLPIWVNEGLAQYFESAIVGNGKMRLGIPDTYSLTVIQRALKANGTVPFDTLLSLDVPQWNAVLSSNLGSAQVLYAQAWSMVYFLVKGGQGKYQPLLEKYLMLIADRRPSGSAFRETFGKDVGAFETLWKRYIGALQPDPMNVAVERLEFLGEALGYLQRQQQPMPTSMDELKSVLRQRGFSASRTVGGVERKISARDAEAFEYPLPTGGKREFQLLEPERAGFPPRILAAGLRPEPMLRWFQVDDALVSDIDYQQW